MSAAVHITFHVSDHAYWRAAERFGRDYDTVLIEDEVREAFLAGRVSRKQPPGFGTNPYSGTLYAWTEDMQRCFVVAAADNGFVVVTSLSPKSPQAAKGPG